MTSREITREGPTDITDIQGIAEQQFFLLLKAKLPQRTTVDYESQIFISSNGGGRIEATVPDFIITKPNGVKIAIEITTENQNGTDPKEKQKRVMRTVAPELRYVVLYRENLMAIQRRHPEFNFFNGKKIKK